MAVVLGRLTAPESEVVRDHVLPTVLANRVKLAKIAAVKTTDPDAATELLRQVASAAKTVIVTIENGAKIVKSEVEDLQPKLLRQPQNLQRSLRKPLSLDNPHTAGKTATAARGSHQSILSSQIIMLHTARATQFFIHQC